MTPWRLESSPEVADLRSALTLDNIRARAYEPAHDVETALVREAGSVVDIWLGLFRSHG